MKNIFKRLTIAFMIVASLFLGGLISTKQTAYASIDSGGAWYYAQLSNQEKTFYDALKTAYDTEQLMSGNANLDVTDTSFIENTLSQSEIKDYVLNGNNMIMASFERAKIAFEYDFPQSTFIDFDKLCLTVGTVQELGVTKFTAIIGPGKYNNYYAQGYTSKEQVISLLSTTTSKINEIIVQLQEQPTLDSKVKQIQTILTTRLTRVYDYQTDADTAQYINSAYGALVLGYADAEGYARTFSMLLNKLGIENVLVAGNVLLQDYNMSRWVWNNVKYGGNWYGIDCALDDNDTKYTPNDNLLIGSNFNQTHFPTTNSVVPASAFSYPTLTSVDYQHDMQFVLQSTKAVDSKNVFKQFSKITVSYNGKGVQSLKQEGLYLVVRTQYLTEDETPQLVWSDWYSVDKYLDQNTYYNNKDYEACVELEGGSYLNQFAITDIDIANLPVEQFVDSDNSGDNQYNFNKLIDFDIETYFIDISNPIKSQVKDRDVTKPTIDSISPNINNFLYQGALCNISIVYDQPLSLKAGYTQKSINIKVTTDPEQAINNSVLSNIKWDGSNTISFTFVPTAFYQTNCYTCTFEIEGLYGYYSHLDPEAVTYQVYPLAQAINNAVNLDNFYFSSQAVVIKDKTKTYQSADSVVTSDDKNLVLAGSKVSDSNAQSIKGLIELNLGTTDSVTLYNLDLFLAGAQVQPTTTATLVFNYPGNTKRTDKQYYLYSFTLNNGAFTPIQEEVIATDYGLLATVKNIGIHAIAVTDMIDDTESLGKLIFASTDANGSIDKAGITQLSGNSISYTITKNSGYKIRKIMLNNNMLELNTSALNNATYTLTLTNDMLQSTNDLRVEFVADSTQTNLNSLGITVALQKCYNQTPTILTHPQNTNVTKGKELTLSVSCSTNSYAELTYQWYKDGELIEGATESTYTTKAVQQTQGEYYVQVISTIGNSVIVVDSATCQVNLNNYAVVWFLAIFFALVAIISIFVLVVNKKLKLPTVKAD